MGTKRKYYAFLVALGIFGGGVFLYRKTFPMVRVLSVRSNIEQPSAAEPTETVERNAPNRMEIAARTVTPVGSTSAPPAQPIASPDPKASDTDGFYEPGQPRVVSARSLSDAVEKVASTSDAERAQLDRVFRIGSGVQAGIDAQDSLDLQHQAQRKLIEQLELRLRLILRDDERVRVAREQLRGLPRIGDGQ